MSLRLDNKKWYPVYFLCGSIAAAAAWLRFAPGQRPEFLLSGIGAVAGFIYFLYRQHLDETRLFKELFIEFNERYGELNDGLNTIRFGPHEGDLSDAERELLFSYFNLCAEEYFFYTAGYIDDRVWKSWRNGICDFFKHPRVRGLWERDRKTDSYYGFRPD
jgi:hypothetical protein